MSKVSVTGSRRVMADVIEAAHDCNLLHVSDYDGSWEGFDNGDPMAGAESASEKLVTVRSLESILGVTEEDAGPTRIVTDDAIDDQLEDVRQEVNKLDDRRSEVEDDLRSVEERVDAAEPFVDLGLDLDLLRGYDSLEVAVGEGDESEVRDALDASEIVTDFETFSGEDTVAAFARVADDAGEDALDDVLVGVEFARVEIPDASGSPDEYVRELEREREQLESRLETAEAQVEEARLEHAGFLLAAEEKLAIGVQKREIPLQFATTDRAFVAEGWVPTEYVDEFERALHDAAGDHVEVEELERASYEPEHALEGHIGPDDIREGTDDPTAAAADGGEQDSTRADGGERTDGSRSSSDRRSDGGYVTIDETPPTVQNNPAAFKPFELLVETINRPLYWEFDPTVVLFLTFPVFFGFMIGDLGYGILYVAIGYWLYSSFDSNALRSLGGIAMWAGGFTMLFGVLYGEFFGLHLIGEYLWAGHPPMEKGLQPAGIEFARTWLVASMLAGLLHMTVGYVFDFLETLPESFTEAMYESGSWALLMLGIWTWIFSRPQGMKPEFLYTIFDGEPFALGFAGFEPAVGLAGLAAAAVGFVVMLVGEVKHIGAAGILAGALESLSALSDVLSYTRIAAVLLAKAGMAFVVNLLFFGVYVTGHGDEVTWHFGLGGMPAVGDVVHGHEVTEIMFGGLVHGGVAAILGGLVVLVVGHLLVLALGITSAGLQAVRLEYVEFFGKFYEGGGETFEPFGYDRTYTTED
jgi:V/A-type H+-transporting ATPase subunit I